MVLHEMAQVGQGMKAVVQAVIQQLLARTGHFLLQKLNGVRKNTHFEKSKCYYLNNNLNTLVTDCA